MLREFVMTPGPGCNLSVIRLHPSRNRNRGILFAGTVAEEGLGGMSGMKALLEEYAGIAATISIDGAGGDTIIYQGTGIRN